LTDSRIPSVSQRAECPLVQVCQTINNTAGSVFEINAIEDVKKFTAELDTISAGCEEIATLR
jgi:hypothetical protein